MKQDGKSFYLLQVSDFHLSEDTKDSAKNALNAVIAKINEMNINIRYLIHTGDIINSKDIQQKIEKQYRTRLEDEKYDEILNKIVKQRFEITEEIMKELKKNLDVMQKNIIICCGNHDKVRYKTREILTLLRRLRKTIPKQL